MTPPDPASARDVARRETEAAAAVALARHPARPRAGSVLRRVLREVTELHGDRLFGDDPAVLGALGRLGDTWLVVVAQEKGVDTDDRVRRNFGMAHPEGYRKAKRLALLAERYGLPLLTVVDTPAAYAGVGAERRGQAWAIADLLQTMLDLRTPTLSVILSEGGSGGALALAAADRVLALEHAIYTVAPPETCATILYRDPAQAPRAAAALHPSVATAAALGIVDELLPEAAPGAHAHPDVAVAVVEGAVTRHLAELRRLPLDDLLAARWARYRLGPLVPVAP